LLHDLLPLAGADRRVVIARELTKLHEEFRAGTLAELADYYSTNEPRGEITVVLEGTGGPPEPEDRSDEARAQAEVLLAEGVSRREVAQRLTATLGLSRNEAYRLVTDVARVGE
jgi:16S rRNA (cytidine1402-2'-O)-methyltransferase